MSSQDSQGKYGALRSGQRSRADARNNTPRSSIRPLSGDSGAVKSYSSRSVERSAKRVPHERTPARTGSRTRYAKSTNRQSAHQRGGRTRSASNRTGSHPLRALVKSATKTARRMIVSAVVSLVLIASLFFYGCDSVTNFGVIHQGVRVGSIEVGHLSEADAAMRISAELETLISSAPVILYASEEAAVLEGSGNPIPLVSESMEIGQMEVAAESTSWIISQDTLDAEVDEAQLARKAYEVGRGGDFIGGRLSASIFGVTIEPALEIPEDRLIQLQDMLTHSLGTPMLNADVIFDGNNFVASDGVNGRVVDSEAFQTMLQQAFFSESADKRNIIVPMMDRAMQIDLESAQKTAERAQQAIAEPVLLTYAEASWRLDPSLLGQLITTSVQQDESGTWHLVPSVDDVLLKNMLPSVMGEAPIENLTAPVDAHFAEEGGQLKIVEGVDGIGIDYPQLSEDLNIILFGEGEPLEHPDAAVSRSIPLQIGTVSPEFGISEAESFDFSTKISEFSVDYQTVPPESAINIQVTSAHINSSIIAPQETWSLINTVGEFTEENGFVNSDVIADGEYAQGMGGGTCTVATTVFNAVYEAGYPIVERVSHDLRSTRYPLGRDAAIAVPFADLKFQNDTGNYLLLTVSCVDYQVTCTLWGVSPGYIVESIVGEFIEGADFERREMPDENLLPGQRALEQEGLRASQVSVTRIVYDSEGNVKSEGTFFSVYGATPEVTRVGV